ncbi:MAG: tyrosine-protein phosphatase [Oscillospiraceae bacterium]|nr:tyrosine-protein phosphatase [Oscillospiraceae bacterium]
MKKFLTLFLALVAALSLAVPTLAAEDAAPWYDAAQQYVTQRSIMTGTDKGFEPLGTTTRAMVFRTLYNMEGKPAVDAAATFTDVAKDAWYADTAAWAEQTGLSNGDNGKFAGDRAVTRAELVTILHRYAKDVKQMDVSVGEDTNILSYSDAFDLPEWSISAFQWACGAGVVEGRGEALAPQDNASRAELATVLMRFDKLDPTAETVVTTIASADVIDKYGDPKLTITSGELAAKGYDYADMVTVKFLDQSVTLPVIPAYRYVGAKASGMVMWPEGEKNVELEIFNGDFAQTYGIAERVVREDGSRYHVAMDGVTFPVEVTIELAEKNGYADTYAIFDLTRTNERADYAELSDAQFGNFRMVTTRGMGAGKLFRASSPVNPSIGRNTYVDAAAEANGVKSFVNLADSAESAAKYAGYAESYYSKQDVCFLNLGVDFSSELNRQGVADAMAFIAKAQTPVLVHCNEGQDRAGFVSALLECLMGASFEEVKQDYMVTFYNYYGVTAGTDQYEQISNNIAKSLRTAFGVEDLDAADLAAEAEDYLRELGVSAATIAAVKKNLGGEALTVNGKVTAIEKYGHALLDVTIEDFNKAGFALGDIVTVAAGSYTDDMPYFDGYYVDRGGYMLRAYPGQTNIAVCINYGKFAATAGIDVGDNVRITLKEKAGALTEQEINALTYTDDPADYASDAVFANFREVALGSIAAGRLYRSASPVNNEHNRAAVANKLAEAAGVKTVLNLADTAEEYASYVAAEGFASAYYKGLYDAGSVVTLGMPINFDSDEFAAGIVEGLTFLSTHKGPYLIHCTEGKDRAGFTAMLLEMLMGATKDEIVTDYMQSYVNYYHLDPTADADKYQRIADKNVGEMLRSVVGLEKGASLDNVNLAPAAETYLLSHGMTQTALAALKANLK